jgi:hypothetical protein
MACGACGVYACNADVGDSRCVDPGRNACDGCGVLDGQPGTQCSTCGTMRCVDDGSALWCDDPGTNACGGCEALSPAPGAPCGQCGSYTCNGPNAVSCSDAGYNVCGGCGALAGVPGASCNGCGTWTCSGGTAVTCDLSTCSFACGDALPTLAFPPVFTGSGTAPLPAGGTIVEGVCADESYDLRQLLFRSGCLGRAASRQYSRTPVHILVDRNRVDGLRARRHLRDDRGCHGTGRGQLPSRLGSDAVEVQRIQQRDPAVHQLGVHYMGADSATAAIGLLLTAIAYPGAAPLIGRRCFGTLAAADATRARQQEDLRTSRGDFSSPGSSWSTPLHGPLGRLRSLLGRFGFLDDLLARPFRDRTGLFC